MNDVTVTLRIAAKALVVNKEGKVLILREAKSYDEGTNHGKYGVPGGRVNPGEPFAEALRREVKEETGLEIQIDKPIYQGEWWPKIKGAQNQIIALYMLCRTEEVDVLLSDEHDTFVWIEPSEHRQYDIMDPEHDVIETCIGGGRL